MLRDTSMSQTSAPRLYESGRSFSAIVVVLVRLSSTVFHCANQAGRSKRVWTRYLEPRERHVLLAAINIAILDITGANGAFDRYLEGDSSIIRPADKHVVNANTVRLGDARSADEAGPFDMLVFCDVVEHDVECQLEGPRILTADNLGER